MTPPQTPKPLTEKELRVGIEIYEETLTERFSGAINQPWMKANVSPLINELKRLRAGQARETSSKSEVKILRDALEKMKETVKHHNRKTPDWVLEMSDCDLLLKEIIAVHSDAIEQADEIKDGKND